MGLQRIAMGEQGTQRSVLLKDTLEELEREYPSARSAKETQSSHPWLLKVWLCGSISRETVRNAESQALPWTS